jgi:hypothetical protein
MALKFAKRLDILSSNTDSENLQIGIHDEESAVPDLKLFFPSVGDVKNADRDAEEGASNIGCHLRPWDSAPTEVKNIFHHYESKDAGRLFHQYANSLGRLIPCLHVFASFNTLLNVSGVLEHSKRALKLFKRRYH